MDGAPSTAERLLILRLRFGEKITEFPLLSPCLGWRE